MSYKKYTVFVHDSGEKEWFLGDKRHCEHGPAIECNNGTYEYYLNGKRHRLDGSAVSYMNVRMEWWVNNELHREDGPAIMYKDGREEWWLNGKPYDKDAFNEEIKRRKQPSCEGKVVTIDGKKYKLTEV